MLTISENAATIIKGLVNQIELENDAGLRIGTKPDDAKGLGLAIAPAPNEGDQVVERDGSRVFLDPAAAPELTDKELDALIDGDTFRFSLRTRS
ncbi:HesB/IscA family protein [Amnibacterium flavum]|uniref:Fe-S cluster assembly protein HesB n=1 Tax=Amnibacterium flavum TaxID=2173173 RepID=A0A2V1HMH2_9MICO|nr:Fe-S cluster assembly protein HesB [Amnibacterium flavum]PVZ93665.1 Fe-S cluster assembly protein HesB [Amnibacterium flavum]